MTYKTILLRYLVFGKVIFKLSFKHARIGGFFQEDYKLHTFPNVRTPQKSQFVCFIAEKKSMIQHSYSNPDEIMAIVDEVNFVKTKGTREHMSSSV